MTNAVNRRPVSIDFADFWHADTLEAKQNNFLYRLLSKRFDLHFEERPEFLLYSCFGREYLRHSGVRIFYTGENTRPNFAHCDWAFTYDYHNHPRHMRLPLYVCSDPKVLLEPRDIEAELAQKTAFCSFIYSNGRAKQRLRFLDKLSKYKPVACGGAVRNNIGGRVEDKIAFLKAFKFNIAFENDSFPGYTSEKIAQAFIGRTVPIYWGNPLIHRDFNPDAFINCHDFRTLDQAVDFVVALDRDDALYRRYFAAPAFPGNRPTQYLCEDRILDRFEEIFSNPLDRPVAKSVSGRIIRLLFERSRRRRARRRGPAAASARGVAT